MLQSGVRDEPAVEQSGVTADDPAAELARVAADLDACIERATEIGAALDRFLGWQRRLSLSTRIEDEQDEVRYERASA